MANKAPKLLVATTNAGKLKELVPLLFDVPFTLVTLADICMEVEVSETGSTLEDNAVLKASAYARLTGLPTLADDSGLEVEALDGEPGPRSSRYAGDSATDQERIAFLHHKLRKTNRDTWDARFRCVMALVWPSEPAELFTGECRGRIVMKSRGDNGFGYDPVFLLPELGKTMAELSLEEKNELSHRAMAGRKAVMALKQRVMFHQTSRRQG